MFLVGFGSRVAVAAPGSSALPPPTLDFVRWQAAVSGRRRAPQPMGSKPRGPALALLAAAVRRPVAWGVVPLVGCREVVGLRQVLLQYIRRRPAHIAAYIAAQIA